MIEVRKPIPQDFEGEFRQGNPIEYAGLDWSFTILEDGEVAAIVGCADYWQGVGHVWAFVKDGIKNGLGVTKAAKQLLSKTVEEKGYHRVQTYTNRTYKDRKWARLCGFECEALLESMSPSGEDYWIYKLVRKS